MHSKRILIVGKDELLISAMLDHLQNHGKHIVYQISGHDPASIRAEIQEVEPDVILLDDTFTSAMVDIFFQLPDSQKLHVIIINSKENNLQIVDTQYIEIRTMEDFINVL